MGIFNKKPAEPANTAAAAAPAAPASPPSPHSTSAVAPATSTAAPTAAGELGVEELRKHAQASRTIHAALGDVVHLLLQIPQQKTRPLGDLEWAIVPGILTGQFALIHAQNKTSGATMPVGAVLWARVSADVDRRLSDPPNHPVRLSPAEWTSGDILWLVEAIGDQRVITNILMDLRTKFWAAKTVKMKFRNPDGTVAIRTLDDVLALQAAQPMTKVP